MNYLRLILFFLCFHFFLETQSYSQHNDFQVLVDELAEAGHRDIVIVQNSDSLKVFYWPVGFRYEYQGFINIKKSVLEFLQSKPNNTPEYIELIQTSWGVQTVTAQIHRHDQTYQTNFTRKYHTIEKSENAPLYYPSKKLLLLLDIPFIANFGQPGDPLIFKTGIRPEIRYRLWNGILAYCQVDLYAHNEYFPDEWYKPGNVGIMIAKTFMDNSISVTNIGAFRTELYGLDEEINVSFFDDKISVALRGGIFGDLYLENNKFRYSDINTYKLILLKVIYSIDMYDSKIEVIGGRFLYGDKGIGIRVARVFKEIEFGFTGIKTKEDIASNVFFSIPLFPKTRKSLAQYGIAPVNHFKFKYWYYDNDFGRDTNISTSLRGIQELSSPNHFRYMSQTFGEK